MVESARCGASRPIRGTCSGAASRAHRAHGASLAACSPNPSWLPEWLPRLEVEGIEIGDGRLDIAIERTGSATVLRRARHSSLAVVQDMPQAPLWGKPPFDEVRDADVKALEGES